MAGNAGLRGMLRAAVFIGCLCAGFARAGSFQTSLFTVGVDTVNCVVADSISIAIQFNDTMRMEDGSDGIYQSAAARTPDVAVIKARQFRFFWSDSLKSNGLKIFRNDGILNDTGIVSGAPVSVYDSSKNLTSPLKYLHADAADTNFFLSVSENGTLNGYGKKPENRQNINGSNGPIYRASQCRFKDTTFLVIYEVSSNKIACKKVTVNRPGSIFQQWPEKTLVEINPAPFYCNPSIAADSQGNSLALWIQGRKNETKLLSYAFTDPALAIQKTATFPEIIDDVNQLNNYDDAPVVSYGAKKFASVNWDVGGIMLRLFEMDRNDSMIIGTSRVTAQTNSRFPALAVNNNHLAVFWTERPMNGSVRLKGVRFPISGGVIDTAVKKGILDMQVGGSVNVYDSLFVNCAVDSSGNVGLCWQINQIAHASILSSRNIYYSRGSWISRPTLIQAGLEDSIYFDFGAAAAGQLPAGCSFGDSLGVSADSADAPRFFPLDDPTALKNNTKGRYNYFQYKISLSASANLLKTPTIKKFSAHWNVKPRFNPLGAVTVGSTPVNNAKFGDTIACRSRIDPIGCGFSMFDADSSDTLYPVVRYLSASFKDTLRGFSDRSSSFSIAPPDVSDTTIACTFSAHDARMWMAQDSVVYFRTINIVPALRVRAVHNGNPRDTLDIAALATINVQQSDSIEFLYSLIDANDPGIKSYASLNGGTVDSTGQGPERRLVFRCNLGRPQGDEFRFSARDPDTAVIIRVICAVNHFPSLDSVSVNGQVAHDNDTVRVTPGSPTRLIAHALDPDVGFWDSLTFTFLQGKRDATTRDSAIMYTPDRFDTAVNIVVRDIFGIRDSLRFFIKFPWYAKDSAENPGLYAARSTLGAVSQIVGSGAHDTVPIIIKNTGNDTLSVVSLRFLANSRRWLNMLIPRDGALYVYVPSDSALFFPLRCPADSTLSFSAVFASDSLSGDGLVHDTVVIGLSDAVHAFDTLPVRLEYNDLPRITACSVQFTKDKPYWLAKNKIRTGSATQKFTFPPFAKISLSFSEPMDSVSALSAIRIYSVFDSSKDGSAAPLPLAFTWASARTRVDVSPRYSRNSAYFGIRPLPGFFIPTDSLRLVVSSSLTDTARTPNGPNGLDVHGLGKRGTADTAFSFRVDSVKFTVTATFPGNAAAEAAPATPIVVVFSSAPLPGTVDTALAGNRMLIVHSAFRAAPISFRRIYVSGDSIVFFPAKRFFYGDTVRCRYRGMWARDSLGYSADVNKNGIPLSMFDTSSGQDDKEWFFAVKYIGHAAVFPSNGSIDISPITPIRVTLTDTAPATAVDLSLRDNRTLILTSRCSGESRIGFDSVRISGTTVAFYPAIRFYYGDSVFCSYRGLTTDDTGRYSFDADKGPIFTNDTTHWSFSIKPIRLVSALPESASASSSIHPEITLSFSDPVYSGTFDSDTSSRNRSISFTSTYSRDSAITFKTISFSPDRRTISIRPSGTYFNNDSLHVAFSGFNKNITYGNADNPPGPGPLICGKEWFFFVRTEEFYTYPNPYKPGHDPRHCSAQGPCGIWFKNLHVLKTGISEVSITIFSMNAHPLFSTKAAGATIRFESRNPELRPEWKWDTRNQRGELVASGLYLYAVYDPNGKVIFKGKLMIVR